MPRDLFGDVVHASVTIASRKWWFVIVFAYYVLFYGGRTLATAYMVCPPWLGAWSANILFAAFAFAAVVLRLRRPELSTAD